MAHVRSYIARLCTLNTPHRDMNIKYSNRLAYMYLWRVLGQGCVLVCAKWHQFQHHLQNRHGKSALTFIQFINSRIRFQIFIHLKSNVVAFILQCRFTVSSINAANVHRLTFNVTYKIYFSLFIRYRNRPPHLSFSSAWECFYMIVVENCVIFKLAMQLCGWERSTEVSYYKDGR